MEKTTSVSELKNSLSYLVDCRTMSRLNELIDVRIVFILFLVLMIMALVLSHLVLLLILFNKTLHSPANLLICNTCLATILFSIIITIKMFIFYMELIITDESCRILAYFGYSFLQMVSYSYVVQALSRLSFVIFHQHQHLLHYTFHFILIICQTLFSFLTVLSSLVTKDILFRPQLMCYVPSTRAGHTYTILLTSFIIPFCSIIIIYAIIYCRVIRSSAVLRQSSHEAKRDLLLLRNILILFLIFLSAGIPWIIYSILTYTTKSSSIALYLMPILATVFAAVLEKICLIFLNHDIRKASSKLLEDLRLIRTSNRVTNLPPSTTHAHPIPIYFETPNIAEKRASMVTVS